VGPDQRNSSYWWKSVRSLKHYVELESCVPENLLNPSFSARDKFAHMKPPQWAVIESMTYMLSVVHLNQTDLSHRCYFHIQCSTQERVRTPAKIMLPNSPRVSSKSPGSVNNFLAVIEVFRKDQCIAKHGWAGKLPHCSGESEHSHEWSDYLRELDIESSWTTPPTQLQTLNKRFQKVLSELFLANSSVARRLVHRDPRAVGVRRA